MIDENEREVLPRGAVRGAGGWATTLRSSKACSEARELPEHLRIVLMVDVAETPTGLRERDVRGEIRTDGIAQMAQYTIRKGV